MKQILLGFTIIGLFTVVGCKKKRQGCTEPNAINYDAVAEENDGSCRYLNLAKLKTIPVTNLTASTAVSGGIITTNGGAPITAKGVCWSTYNSPSITDMHTTDGSGNADFTTHIKNLSSQETYYLRAYATNSLGTSYGNLIKFTTPRFECSGSVFEWNDVTSPTGKVWMDRNLGAKQVAASAQDEDSYGDLYQWGRPADGHQCRNSNTTTDLSSKDVPGHDDFITSNTSPIDWRSPQNGNLWNGVNGVNNPCPSGYRLPTEMEWTDEVNTWSRFDAVGAYESVLKLPKAGYRSYSDGTIAGQGIRGLYWTNATGTNARNLIFTNIIVRLNTSDRALGGAVRCIKD